MSDVKFQLISHVSSGELINCLLGTLWTILLISVLWIIVADETELTDVILLEDERFDVTEGFEESSNFRVSHLEWDVLDVDVVLQFLERSSVLWLKLQGVDLWIVLGHVDGLGGNIFLIEADETISS